MRHGNDCRESTERKAKQQPRMKTMHDILTSDQPPETPAVCFGDLLASRQALKISSTIFDRINISRNWCHLSKTASRALILLAQTLSSVARNINHAQCSQGLNLQNLKSENRAW
jgi:hypothetical protein